MGADVPLILHHTPRRLQQPRRPMELKEMDAQTVPKPKHGSRSEADAGCVTFADQPLYARKNGRRGLVPAIKLETTLACSEKAT